MLCISRKITAPRFLEMSWTDRRLFERAGVSSAVILMGAVRVGMLIFPA